MYVFDLKGREFENQICQGKRSALVEFWAPWCSHCLQIAPMLDQVAQDNPNVWVVKVNVDEAPEAAQAYGIMGIPTLVAFREGQAVGTLVVPESQEAIQTFLEKNLSQSKKA